MPRKLISILENNKYYYDPIQLLIDRDEDLKKWHFRNYKNTYYEDFYDVQFVFRCRVDNNSFRSIYFFYNCTKDGQEFIKKHYSCGENDEIYFIYRQKEDFTEMTNFLVEKYAYLTKNNNFNYYYNN